jgi:N-methylhydantoinase A/oxoprolinase/acetone carboxylase beta subunit
METVFPPKPFQFKPLKNKFITNIRKQKIHHRTLADLYLISVCTIALPVVQARPLNKSDNMSIGLGLDTGGTYTDAVIIDINNNTVLEKAKALTTKDNLAKGIENSIANFDNELLSKISIVSLSSTLATNSIVEGHGCKIALICIGREPSITVNSDEYICIKGKHDLNGDETEPLDTTTATIFLNVIKNRVDCIAITGYMSVRNPEHEIEIEKLSKKITGKPVVCGYQLSSSLGFNERTITTVMNAKLIPIIKELIMSVIDVMGRHSISAPIMIVKGDGSITNIESAKERPVETILCGPAASLNGARVLTGIKDAVVVDMGGTTTDIGILKNGYPDIEKKGAVIGGFRTHVKAANITTSGIGGDSRIFLNGKTISLKPQRVVPLCIAASLYPDILNDLRDALKIPVKYEKSFDDKNVVSDIEFFMTSKPMSTDNLPILDREFIALISAHPITLRRAANILNTHPLNFNISNLEETGYVLRIGLTPTDLLHAEGTYVEYNAEASNIGVEYASRRVGISSKNFINHVKEMVVKKITNEIMMKILSDKTGTTSTCPICGKILDIVTSGIPDDEFNCRITLKDPIVGIGAPVDSWLPQVSKKLNTQYVSSEDSMAGNAIGAISGCIVESISVLIEPKNGASGYKDPCTSFSKMGKFEFDNINDAIKHAKSAGEKYVGESVIKSGASNFNVEYKVDEKTYDTGLSKAILDVTVTVTASGKPVQMI